MSKNSQKIPEEEDSKKIKKRRSPGSSLESREKYLISLSYDEAERQINSGRATSQLLTHFLKLGSTRERLEKRKIEGENKLLDAKVDTIRSQKNSEILYANALKAMSTYSGRSNESTEDT